MTPPDNNLLSQLSGRVKLRYVLICILFGLLLLAFYDNRINGVDPSSYLRLIRLGPSSNSSLTPKIKRYGPTRYNRWGAQNYTERPRKSETFPLSLAKYNKWGAQNFTDKPRKSPTPSPKLAKTKTAHSTKTTKAPAPKVKATSPKLAKPTTAKNAAPIPEVPAVNSYSKGVNPLVASTTSWMERLGAEDRKKEMEKLKRAGLESTLLHDFKSPYIVDPVIYPTNPPLESKDKGKEEKKIVISCVDCEPWFFRTNLTMYNEHFRKCPQSACVLDKTGARLKEAKLAIFFANSNMKKMKIPRPRDQIWAMAFWEAPKNYGYHKTMTPYLSAFNWTFNYRADADIFSPNNRLAWKDSSQLLDDDKYLEIAKRKNKTAAWFVSNCKTPSKREDFVKILQKHIDVDIYGKCGPKKCPRRSVIELKKETPHPCDDLLEKNYKFYLGLENSMCKDYVTEKALDRFGRFLGTHIVPVVRGGFDYEKYLPKGAFVNAANFKSATDLAKFLKDLAKDNASYAQMLKEKDRLVTLDYCHDWCDICAKLHAGVEHKQIANIRDATHKDACYNPKDLF